MRDETRMRGLAIAFLLAAMAAGCGGGDGGGSSSPPVSPPPPVQPPAPEPPPPPPPGTLALVAGTLDTTRPDCPTDGSLTEARFTNIGAMTADAGGRLYVVDNAHTCTDPANPEGFDSVRVVDFDAGTVSTLARHPRSRLSYQISSLWGGIAVAPDGRVVVMAPDPGFVAGFPLTFGAIYEISADGRQVNLQRPCAGYGSQVAIDSQGNTYLQCGGLVVRNAQGVQSLSLADAQTNEPVRPSGIALGPDDQLYLTTSYSVYRRTAPGTASRVAGRGGAIQDGTGDTAQFEYIHELAVDPAGNAYVIDWYHTVRKITPQGLVTTVAGQAGANTIVEPGALPGKLKNASSLAITRDGKIFVQADQAILQITP